VPNPKKNVMDEFEIYEISGVDRPCQEPALSVLIKQAPETSGSLAPTASDSPTNPQPTMTEITQEQLDAEIAKSAALKVELAVAKAVGELNDAERSHYGSLAEADQTAFLAKSPTERADIIKAAESADAVVYKSVDGMVFRASDDDRLIAMAKQNDIYAKQVRDMAIEKAEAGFAKSAEALAHLPGEVATKVAVLRAIAALPTDVQEAAHAMLKAHSDGAAAAFVTKGVEGVTNGTDAQDLDGLAKSYAAKNNVSLPDAYEAVLSTPEGMELYNKSA
jgi:hypothetical protein